MLTSIDESTQERNDFFTQLNKIIDSKLPIKKSDLLKEFSYNYYRLVSLDDLKSRNIEDLYGSVLSHWNFLSNCDSDKTFVKVFNPEYDKHGWYSSHTVIEIVHPDVPFVVDSISKSITKLDLTIHLMITPGGVNVTREGKNIKEIKHADFKTSSNYDNECLIYLEIDKQNDLNSLKRIESYLQEVLADVRLVVNDWTNMRAQSSALIDELKQVNGNYDKAEVKEATDFVKWLANDHFTFIGCCDYIFVKEKNHERLQFVEKSGYGLLSRSSRFKLDECFAGLPQNAKAFTTCDDLIVITESSMRSTVHRNSYLDYIAIKLFGPDGEVLGERRFLGLYTATAYSSSIRNIPFVRQKVNSNFLKANLAFSTHAGKNLLYILESLPRDDLFQASADDIFDIAMSIMHMQERKQIRLFMREDRYKRFYSCLVYLPREIFNSLRRTRIGDILLKELGGNEISFATYFSESILTRVHFIVRVAIGDNIRDQVSVKEIEDKIIACCRRWRDELYGSLTEELGEETANRLYNKYYKAFPSSYSEQYSARKAVFDILQIEKVIRYKKIAMSMYSPLEEISGSVRLKLFNYAAPLKLSEVLPVLENMGLSVVSENNNRISLNKTSEENCYINDFSMHHECGKIINVEKIADNFQEAFLRVWDGDAESDKFNQLIIDANISWREAAMLRAYSKYFRQIGFTFSETYIQETALKNIDMVKDLVELFNARFKPSLHAKTNFKNHNLNKQNKITENIIDALDKITNLDEDRILRKFLDVILATIRTNYFQTEEDGTYKNYISFKFDPSKIPDLILPLPMFEIFIYSPRVEGVHLRGGKVARGGLRWSDRREDFRTEVLGLMKAQQVKNAVIVPAGAKGGFVCKQLHVNFNREQIYKEVVACYSVFIRGLLDITDNLDGDIVDPSKNVVRYDDEDTYLVVAADKGTATFSDIANNIASNYNFWLGDAFASGGSVGYDHKKMGITARGAWESVKRHFFELGLNVQSTDFTAIGIGDMSGDVFGNGMLLSKHIKLVAAFNHMHIFLDPNPNSEISYNERARLFDLDRSTWQDYKPELISKGGGVYSRHVKSIKLSYEIKEVLGIDDSISHIVPNDLIQYILKAPVDLLWNGGIGTYVKSEIETDSQVSDRANDSVRVNGKDLNCRVIGEGGNLGFTQLGRVEASLSNKILFTDFIDNAAGVDCSDHEVNIKILLNSVVKNGDLTIKQRNQLLENMTENVSKLVLRNNYDQCYAISLAASRAPRTIDEHAKFIYELEKESLINRELEFLPTDEEITERKAHDLGLTRPEISVLMAYSKNILKKELLDSSLPDKEEYLFALCSAFPEILHHKFSKNLYNHKLRREIVATQLSSDIINSMGFTYIKRLFDETGAGTPDIVISHLIASEIFEKEQIFHQLFQHDDKLDINIKNKILHDYIRLIRRSVRWLLRNHRSGLDLSKHILYYKPLIKELWEVLPSIIEGKEKKFVDSRKKLYIESGMSEDFANKLAYTKLLYSAMDIIYIACNYDYKLNDVARLYFALGNNLDLTWFRDQITAHPVDDSWDALARAGSRDDVDLYQREIALGILQSTKLPNGIDEKITKWALICAVLVCRWQNMLSNLKTTKSKEFTIFSVALRELLDLSQLSKHYLCSSNESDEIDDDTVKSAS